MLIIIDEDEAPDNSLNELLNKAGGFALELAGVDASGCEVSLAFVSPEEIRALNLQYRSKDEVTDVLSFPMYETADEIADMAADMDAAPVLLGDIVICKEAAELQAAEIGHSTEREIIYLFIHGVFHLLGYDHESEEDKSAMCAAEKKVLKLIETEA